MKKTHNKHIKNRPQKAWAGLANARLLCESGFISGTILILVSTLAFVSGYMLQLHEQRDLKTHIKEQASAIKSNLLLNEEISQGKAKINIALLVKLKNNDVNFVIDWLERSVRKEIVLDPATKFFMQNGGTEMSDIDELNNAQIPSKELFNQATNYQKEYCSNEPCLGI